MSPPPTATTPPHPAGATPRPRTAVLALATAGALASPWRLFAPLDFEQDVAHAKPGFGEYLNPRALELVLSAAEDGTWEKLGTRWLGLANRPGITVLDPIPYARWSAAGTGPSQELAATRRAGRIEVELPGEEGTLVLLEQHDAGWEARLDGQPAAVAATAEGLLQLAVPADARRAGLRYRLHGWDVVAGRTATLLALVVCAALALANPKER